MWHPYLQKTFRMTIQLILCQQVFKDATYEDKVWVFGCIIEIRRLYQNSNK